MIFILLDTVVMFAAAFVALRYMSHPTLGLLFMASCVFIAHAAVNLSLGEYAKPNSSVVYDSVPMLQTAHKALFSVLILYLIINIFKYFREAIIRNNSVFQYLVFSSALILFVSIFTFRDRTYDLKYHDVAMEILFFVFVAFVHAISFRFDPVAFARDYRYFLALCLLCVTVCLCEMTLLRVQAATNYMPLPTGDVITAYRTSGIFMNPNWAANWAAFFAGASIFGYQRGYLGRSALIGIAASMVIIFLTGSRGGMLTFIIISAVLLGQGLLSTPRRSLVAAGVAAAAFFGANAFAFLAGLLSPHGVLAERFYGLYFRWILENRRLAVYVYQLLHSKFTGSAPPAMVSGAAVESISGRLEGSGADNGFLAFYYSCGYLGILAISLLFLTCIAAVIFAIRAGRHDAEVRARIPLAIAGILAVANLAMQLRAFSVFPIWIFSAAILAMVLSTAPSTARRAVRAT